MALPPVRTLPAFNFADNQLQSVMMGVRDAIYDLQGINKRSLVQDLGEGRKLSLEPDDRLLSTADLQTGGAIKSEIDTTVTDQFYTRFNAVTEVNLSAGQQYQVDPSEAGSILLVTGDTVEVAFGNDGILGDVVTVVNYNTWNQNSLPETVQLLTQNTMPIGSEVRSAGVNTYVADPYLSGSYSSAKCIYIQSDPCIWLARINLL